MGATHQFNAPSLLEQAVDAACCVLNASDEVEALELVTNRHPAYGELLRLRACAERHDLVMSEMAPGSFALRRRPDSITRLRPVHIEGDRA